MKYLFLDESGDMGFGDKSSRYFVITILICGIKEEQELKRVIKRVRQKILKKKLKNSTEIKWNNSNESIKQKVINELSKINFEVFTIILDKSKVYDYLKKEKHKLYNYLSKLIITECSINGKCELTIDRSKNKRSLRDDFDRYIRFNLRDRVSNLSIKHEDSKLNGCLQALDFVSGAIFNKYEFKNSYYHDVIRNKIVMRKDFPQSSGP